MLERFGIKLSCGRAMVAGAGAVGTVAAWAVGATAGVVKGVSLSLSWSRSQRIASSCVSS